MVKFALAKKIGMTRTFDEAGLSIAGTLLAIQPVKVMRTILESKNGYNAVVVADENSKKKTLREFKVEKPKDYKVNQIVAAGNFEIGDSVIVSAKTKGKGFAGVIKRHSFSRGPMSHGSNHHRAPGSIGGGYPQRVVLGRKMPGRLGGINATTKNLKVISVDQSKNILLVSGSVPGPKEAFVKVYATSKVQEESKE